MSLAILDQIQTLDVDSQATFAEAGKPFTDSQKSVRDNLGGKVPPLPSSDLTSSFDQVTQPITSNPIEIPTAPFSVAEIQTQITGKLGDISSISIDTLTQSIPTNPGADTFKGLAVTDQVNSSLSSLTSSITGNANFGQLGIPKNQSTLFDKFQEFINNAQAFPGKVLDAIIKAFKNFIDKLSNPDEWLDRLSSDALTEIFVEQIQELNYILPNGAIQLYTLQLNQQTQLYKEYQDFLKSLDTENLSCAKIIDFRKKIKSYLSEVESQGKQIGLAVKKFKSFDIDEFSTRLANLPNSGGRPIETLSQIFQGIEDFVNSLKERITTVTEQLKTFITKIQDLINQAITKVSEIGNKIFKAIADKIEQAGKALDQVQAYLTNTINKLVDFVKQTAAKSDEIVKPLKQAINQFATAAVQGIETVAQQIKQTTQTIEKSLDEVNKKITTELSQEQLKAKIKELLGKVTGVLQSQTVKDALNKADQGIDQVVAALQKVSLEPAFQLAVTQTNKLELELKKIDVSTMGTAQKTALKVGVKILQEIDVPRVVNPELTAAFDSLLYPVVGLVDSIQKEIKQVDEQVKSFAPGTLVKTFLDPYIQSLVTELNKYKPSVLLETVKQLYETLLEKLEILNPNQLLERLQELYDKLLAVVDSLSPEKLTQFLTEKLNALKGILDNLPVEQLINKVIEAIGDVEKLLGGLGLDNVLNSGFWQTLEEILSLNLQEQIQQVDTIKAKIIERVNNIDETKLIAALTSLRANLTKYATDPSIAISNAKNELNQAWDNYQEAAKNFTTQWEQTKQLLDNFNPPPELAVDYRDLLTRMTDLSQRLVTAKVTNDPTKKDITPSSTPTREKLDNLLTSATVRSDEQIIADLKKVIPNEIESQLTGPVKRILSTLDEILAQPRTVLAEIKKVIQRLQSAPTEIANILKNLTADFGKLIRDSINKVKTAIDGTVNKVIDSLEKIYNDIRNKLKELRPLLILNTFYDVSDFKGGTVANLLTKLRRKEPLDAVSAYFWTTLDETQKALLENGDPNHTGTQKALFNALNKLLTDVNFYGAERFKLVAENLPQEAKDLIAKPQRDELETIRLNRLLLETAYPQEIILSLQSIYPFFLGKLKDIYPTEIVKQLDQLHANIVKLILDIPKALEGALNDEYQKVVAAYQEISQKIDRIFKALIERLYGLKSELGIGLEDVSDAYERLLVAIPV
jgi:phage-related protein